MRRQFGLPRQPIAPAKKKPGNNKPGKKHGKKHANKPANIPVTKEFVPVNDHIPANDNANAVTDRLRNNNIKFEQAGSFIVIK